MVNKNAAQSVKDYINKFSDILIPWHNRMVIGGIYALKMHGLKTRDTADLDMIVYNPSEEFIWVLQNAQLDEREDYDSDIGDSRRRSYKLTRDGLTIDFLIEHDQCQPSDLLTFRCSDRDWPVQRIDYVINAKRKYGRDKDHQDLHEFAEQNFKWN